MSTVNYSVPEDVKKAFNKTFKNQNKSAIIAELMAEAVERAQRRKRSKEAFERIIARRAHAPQASEAKIRAARGSGRP